MAVGVITNCVSIIEHTVNQVRKTFCRTANHEKICAHLMCGKNIEDYRRVRRIGAVVEGEADFWLLLDVRELVKVSKNNW